VEPDRGKSFAETLRGLLPYTSALVVIAALYVGGVFYLRWSSNRDARGKVKQDVAERARVEVELNGGASLKILALYATPVVVAHGQKSQLCYSVANAKTVSFEPKVEGVWPSRSRCVDIAPIRTTTYLLTARDDAGHTETAEVKVEVR
jgi:hypothetical protein